MTLQAEKLSGLIGARLTGIDLSAPIAAETGAKLQRLLGENQVLIIPGQRMTLDHQKALTKVFGNPLTLPYVKPMDHDPEVIRVYKGADERGGVFGGDWHSDFSFLERPPAGSVLAAETLPPFGGDTIWASQAAAWDHLPEPLQQLLLGRDAVHVGKPYGVKWAPPRQTRSGAGVQMSRGDPSADEERLHPCVLENPKTGRKMLFVNPTYVTRIDGLSEAESAPLLTQIQQHITRPEFCYRHRWSAGDVAIWDNLATQHFAVNDYHGHERLMYRTTWAGPSPRELAATASRDRQYAAAE
ncbi:MAG: TauD/TfdA family dioxygenase [Anderseniella sp.]|nr:TauD/TfdA family dioxygenase [Anderseniella sp.]